VKTLHTGGQPFVNAVLKRISDIVASLDDSKSILDALVGLVSQMLQVDRCSLMLLDPGSNILRIRAGHGIPPSTMKRARIHIGEGISGWVALHGRPLLIKDVADHPLFKRQSAPRYRTRSLLSVPLMIGNRIIGVLNVNNKRNDEIFSKSDQLLLGTVANLVVIALERSKLREIEEEKKRIDSDIALAQKIQRAFLPRKFPKCGGLEFAAYCLSAHRVAGDFYDVVPLPDKGRCVVLGDVCGKGIPAALYMARVMTYFRAVATLRQAGAELLPTVNRFLAGEWTSRTFATACLLVIETNRPSISVCSAGHAPPYLLREKDPTPRMIEIENGFPLGVEADCRFDPADVPLENGDSLVLYTDGITDAVNTRGELFGYKRFEEVLRAHRNAPGKRLIDAVAKALTKFSVGHPQTDDQTLLVVRKT